MWFDDFFFADFWSFCDCYIQIIIDLMSFLLLFLDNHMVLGTSKLKSQRCGKVYFPLFWWWVLSKMRLWKINIAWWHRDWEGTAHFFSWTPDQKINKCWQNGLNGTQKLSPRSKAKNHTFIALSYKDLHVPKCKFPDPLIRPPHLENHFSSDSLQYKHNLCQNAQEITLHQMWSPALSNLKHHPFFDHCTASRLYL